MRSGSSGVTRGARAQPALDHPGVPAGRPRHDGAPPRAHSHAQLDRGVPGPRAWRDLRHGQGGRGAVHALLAAQLRPYEVTVNTLAPGDTRTGRFLNTRAVPEERLVEAGTLERIATVDEVARVVEFFAGPLGAFVPVRCCGSMAAPSAGRGERPTTRAVHERAHVSCRPAPHPCSEVRHAISAQPRPMNGILVAMMVMNWTLVSSGIGHVDHGARHVVHVHQRLHLGRVRPLARPWPCAPPSRSRRCRCRSGLHAMS